MILSTCLTSCKIACCGVWNDHASALDDLVTSAQHEASPFKRALVKDLLKLVEPRKLEGEPMLSRLVGDHLVGPAVDRRVDL